MKDDDIYKFIDFMEDMGDEWEFDDAKRVYGDWSLEDALDDRLASVKMFYNALATAISYMGGHNI